MSSQFLAHRSPKAGSARKRSTSCDQASGEVSAKKRSISVSDGGSPRRSRLSRRISDARSARGVGTKPFRRNRSWTKLSIALSVIQSVGVGGGWWRTGGTNDQWRAKGAPCWIQRMSVVICDGDRGLFSLTGGIRRSGSPLRILAISALFCGCPGTIAAWLLASLERLESRRSSRKLASRFPASEPWHFKQCTERIARTSRLKSTTGSAAARHEARARDPSRVSQGVCGGTRRCGRVMA